MQKCEPHKLAHLFNNICLSILFYFLFLSIYSISGQKLDPPWITWPTDNEYFVNTNVSLNCSIKTNVSDAIIYWVKVNDLNDVTILFMGLKSLSAFPNYNIKSYGDGIGTQLNIINFGQNDDAIYICGVTGLNLKTSANISAIGYPSEPLIQSSIIEVDIEENIPLFLLCHSTGGNPKNKIKFSWYRNGIHILDNVTTIYPAKKFGEFSSTLAWKFMRDDFLANFTCTVEHLSFSNSLLSKTNQFKFKYGPIVQINSESPLSLFKNSDFNLYCSVDSFPIMSLDNIIWTNNVNMITKGPILLLKNVKKMDSGNYSCSATSNNKTKTSILYINIIYAPVLSPTLHKQQIPEGKNATITFNIDSNPSINSVIIWRKNKQELINPNYIYEPNNRIILFLPNLTRTDEGEYLLEVYNEMRNSSGNIFSGVGNSTSYLEVLFKPGDATLMLVEAMAIINTKVSLLCLISEIDNRTTIKYYWTSSTGLNTSSSDPTYNITVVSLNDIGNYTCLAENLVGRGKYGSYFLDIIIPPTWTMPNLPSNMTTTISELPPTLICAINSRPSMEIVWSHQGKIINLEDSRFSISVEKNTVNLVTLTISKLMWKGIFISEDYGMYICSVTNISQEFQLLLKYPPILKNYNPIISGDPDSSTVISSSYSAYPAVEYKWFKNSIEIKNDDSKYLVEKSLLFNETYGSSQLRIFKLIRDDEGAYTCQATNEIATINSTFHLYAFPATPTGPYSTYTTWESALLKWNNSENSGKIKNFILSYGEQFSLRKRSAIMNSISINVSNLLVYNLTGLYPNKKYIAEVIAENRLGKSAPSPLYNFSTPVFAINPPTNVIYDRPVNQLTATIDNATLEPVCLQWSIPNSWSECVPWQGTQTWKINMNLDQKILVRNCLMRRQDVCSTSYNANIVEASSGLSSKDKIILGCVLGGLLLLLVMAIMALIIYCCCCRKKDNQLIKTSSTQTDLPPVNLSSLDNEAFDFSYDSDYKRKSDLSYPEKIYNMDEDINYYLNSDTGDSGMSTTPKAARRIVHEVVV